MLRFFARSRRPEDGPAFAAVKEPDPAAAPDPANDPGTPAPGTQETDPAAPPEDVTAELEILRTGTFQAMDGQSHQITAAMLAEIVASFDRDGAPVPAVVGHPKSDDPAYGWVRDLAVKGDRLTATLFKVDPGFAKTVADGRFRKVSVKLYTPDAPANPAPGSWGLRHVGFLGAAAPAVSGLKPVEFAGGDEGTVEFQAVPSVMDHPAVRRALARRDDEGMLEELADAGIIHPRHVAPALAFMDFVDEQSEGVAFAAPGEAPTDPLAWFRRFLEEVKVQPPAGQIVKETGPAFASSGPAFSAPRGYAADRDGMDQLARIQSIAESENLTFEAALDRFIASGNGTPGR